MKKFLLDTSVIIDFLRVKEKQETLLYKLSSEDLFISVISHTELYAGKSIWEKTAARDELELLFSGMTILPFTKEISVKSGELKAKHQRIGLLDCMIGSTAIVHDLPFVTLNTKDFVSIEGIMLYPVTN
jgi:predicted nucleic acid-binding protein